MGLVLGLTCGESLSIGSLKVTLLRIITPQRYVVEAQGTEYTVSSESWTFLSPGCQVRSTLPRHGNPLIGRVRIQINAPLLPVVRH